MSKGKQETPRELDPITDRYHCKVCNVGQGLTASATFAQREAFDFFVKHHEKCQEARK